MFETIGGESVLKTRRKVYDRAMTSNGSTYSSGGGLPATTFFSKTYDETQVLVVEAMHYAKYSGEMSQASQSQAPQSQTPESQAPDSQALQAQSRSLACSLESLRLTTRLTQIMAWLLFQRAVHAGELSPEQALTPSNRLGGKSVCNDRRGEHMMVLPSGLRDLLLRSRKLYQRIARLDEMIARDTIADESGPLSPQTDPLL